MQAPIVAPSSARPPAAGQEMVPATDHALLEQCRRLRRQGSADEALRLLADAPAPWTSIRRVEAALCAFDVGDVTRLRAFVADDAAAQRAVAPLEAVLVGGDPPPGRQPMIRGLSAVARAIRMASEGDLDKARQRLQSVPKNARHLLDFEGHSDVLKLRRGNDGHAYAAAFRLMKRQGDDADALEALGITFGSVPWLAEAVLARRNGLDDRARRSCARSLRYHTDPRSDSPAGLLARNPSSVSPEHRGRLHLHRGFAAIKSEPARAERELDAALARGEDALEVWRGRVLLARSAERAQKAFGRLLSAVERCGPNEAILVVALALLDVLLDRERFDRAQALLQQIDDLLAVLKVEGAETVRTVETYRLHLLEAQGDTEAVRTAARGLIERVPGAGIGWAALITLETDVETAESLLKRGRAAVEASTAGPRKHRDLEMIDAAAARIRARSGVIRTAGEWARAYFDSAASCGAPPAALEAARDPLDEEHRQATVLVEVALRAHRSAEGFEGWLGALLQSADSELAFGAAEVVGHVRAAALRPASSGLSTERIVAIALSVGGKVAEQLLLGHAHRLARPALQGLKQAVRASMTVYRIHAVDRLLEPDFALADLIDEGDAYQPQDQRLADIPPTMEFIKLLPYDRQLHYVDRLLGDPNAGPSVENVAMLRALVQEVKEVAAARGVHHNIPLNIELLANLPSTFLDGIGDDLDASFYDPGPRQPPPRTAEQRARDKARKKRQKRDRKRQRGKKK